jgi:hypothetical protein
VVVFAQNAFRRCPVPGVVPSQVVAFITNNPVYEHDGVMKMNAAKPGVLPGVLVLADQIPAELLTMDNDVYALFICAKEQIREILATWISNRNAGHDRQSFQFNTSQNPLALIRDALAKCPDESPSPVTSQLKFIGDPDLRTNLRNDIGAIDLALSNSEWKAATVLAGSTIEALLLWSLGQRPPADVTIATTTLLVSGKLSRQPDANLERWDLHEYNEVASNLGIIEDDTYIKTNLAREYRNLIHPGRAQRLQQKCDRGTALASVAALEHVVRDLS